ncbi:hypothetical protein O1M54_32050 [Streptomyces diastatochromogenes]|nr:hypothetical protein [Streptomyces diastatochromogenes]
MPTKSDKIELSEHELREITGYAADCARRALSIFEESFPADTRPREAIDAADAFAAGGRRTGALRQRGGPRSGRLRKPLHRPRRTRPERPAMRPLPRICIPWRTLIR